MFQSGHDVLQPRSTPAHVHVERFRARQTPCRERALPARNTGEDLQNKFESSMRLLKQRSEFVCSGVRLEMKLCHRIEGTARLYAPGLDKHDAQRLVLEAEVFSKALESGAENERTVFRCGEVEGRTHVGSPSFGPGSF